MSKIPYQKLPKTFNEQVELLESRGLYIPNKERAAGILERVSYNRLSNYWYPMLVEPKELENFKSGSSFETIFKLYQFDSELRTLVFNAIEQIEVAVRTQIIYHLSHQYGTGFWFLEKECFQSIKAYSNALIRIQDAVDETKQAFIVKYKQRYSDELPPSWKSFELLSFRMIYSIYKNVKRTPEKLKVSDFFGLNYEVFISWLDTLVYIRNICAHHARLWNTTLTITPVWPKKPRGAWVSRSENDPENLHTKDKKLKTYAGLCIIQFVLGKSNPYNKFKRRLSELISEYPEADIQHMGFTNNWSDEALWA
ncbi:MAG: Abi family protein [Saprospiraceae bacterium]|nr:Abi family protein [Saprospiraceae bacterium]